MSTTTLEAQALKLFNTKLPNVERVLTFRVAHRNLSAHLDDLRQLAMLTLWKQSLRAVVLGFNISAALIVASAMSAWLYQRKREAREHREADLIPAHVDDDTTGPMALAAAPAETYRVGGVKLSPADLAIDFPRELAAYHETITTGELAERLGLSKQRVLQRAQAGELGGVKQRGRWCFPSTAGLPEPADPH